MYCKVVRFVAWIPMALTVLVVAQTQKERWQRLYTSEDAIIEINVSTVTFGSASIGRARFRTAYSKPQLLQETDRKYQSRLETIEFKCPQQGEQTGLVKRYPAPTIAYRLYGATLLDAKGKVVKTYEWAPSDWKEVKFGSMMERLSGPACKLIEEKRRNP